MQRLEQFCFKICSINGLMTYMISPEYYTAVLCDSVLLTELSVKEEDLRQWVKIATQMEGKEIYMAFVYHETWIERFRWMPVLCMKSGEEFFHVYYHDSWICRECGYHNGAVVMPMSEADPVFYQRIGKGVFETPPGFRKMPCKNCGRMLQNHLMRMKCH